MTNFIERVNLGPDRELNDEWMNFVCFFNDTLIGQIQATAHTDWAEIAYLFDPFFQGKGYATESVTWLMDHLQDQRNIREFWATTDPENKRSVALLIRAGFLISETLEREILSHDPGDLVFKRLL